MTDFNSLEALERGLIVISSKLNLLSRGLNFHLNETGLELMEEIKNDVLVAREAIQNFKGSLHTKKIAVSQAIEEIMYNKKVKS